MLTDQARVSLVAQGTQAIACELCTSETNIPNATVVVQHPRGGAVHLAAPPILVLEFSERLRDPADGTSYVARVYGRRRLDGTWEGWLEFVAVGAAVSLRTEQETTQSSQQGIAYWASGLERSYLEGAFARAHKDSAAAVAV